MQVKPGPKKKKKIALAMSGCGGRAVAYIGMLDVFKEHGVPIDMIAATSSATFVACAYSAGTMDRLKDIYHNMGAKELFSLFEPTFQGGIFSLDGIEDEAKKFLIYENLEDYPIPVAIVAADLINGEEVIITMGDALRAIKASCSMPGLFEPVIWGDKVLIDGGLFSIIPVEAARAWGADLVVGVDMSTSRDIFSSKILHIKRGYNFLKKPVVQAFHYGRKAKEYFLGIPEDELNINNIKVPKLGSIFGKALDYAIYERRKTEFIDCDYIIRPDVKGFGDMTTGKFEGMYEEGRKAGLKAIPSIKALLTE